MRSLAVVAVILSCSMPTRAQTPRERTPLHVHVQAMAGERGRTAAEAVAVEPEARASILHCERLTRGVPSDLSWLVVWLTLDETGQVVAATAQGEGEMRDDLRELHSCVTRALSSIRFAPGRAGSVSLFVAWVLDTRSELERAMDRATGRVPRGLGMRGTEGSESETVGAGNLLSARSRELVVPRARAEIGVPTVRGPLSARAIRRVARDHLRSIRFCYEHELRAQPTPAGRVEVQLVIAADGTVSSSSIVSDTTGQPAVGACLATSTRHWTFPAVARRAPVEVLLPLSFEHE